MWGYLRFFTTENTQTGTEAYTDLQRRKRVATSFTLKPLYEVSLTSCVLDFFLNPFYGLIKKCVDKY